jgi:hypothetical protein
MKEGKAADRVQPAGAASVAASRSQAEEPHPAASLAPPPRSLLGYAPAFVLLAVAIADGVQYADTDLWGHVRFGQIMLRTGHLIRHDIFSYSAPGAPWTNHEWLAEVVMALLYNALGVAGLKLLKFFCAAATVLLLCAGVAESGAAMEVQFVVLLVASLAIAGQVQFRPQLADQIFLAALLLLLARESNGRRARWWLVLPMMVLWANLHGGFFVGVVVLAMYAAVAGALEVWDGCWPRRGLRLGLLALVALAVTLINPYGVAEWRVVIHNFQNPVTMHLNVEFQSLFHQLGGGGFRAKLLVPYVFPFILMAALAVGFALAPRRDDLALVAIAALMSYAAFYAIRNMALAAIACAAPAARHLDLAMRHRCSVRGLPTRSERAHAALHIQLFALGGAVFVALQQGMFSSRLADFQPHPVGAQDFMQRHNLYGNVLPQYEWGVYVIWHQAPRSKVFFDSFELRYPEPVQEAYVDFAFRGGAAAAAMLKGYPHDYVLVETRSRMYRLMMGRPDWKLIYRDPVAALFARTDSIAARIPGVPVLRDTAPPSFFP